MENTLNDKATRAASLIEFLKNDKWNDVQFLIGPNQEKYDGNKIVFSSISPVFEAMLTGNMRESKENSVIIEDILPDHFKCIHNFAYNMDLQITENNLLSIYKTCDKYQIKSLVTKIEQYFYQIVSPKNICKYLGESVNLHIDTFTKYCIYYLDKYLVNPSPIFKSESFFKMNGNVFKIILSSDNLNIGEENLFEIIIKWVQYKCQNKNKQIENNIDENDDEKNNQNNVHHENEQYKLLNEIAPWIRFGLMSSEYFIKKVQPLNFLNNSEIVQIMNYQITKNGTCGKFITKSRNIQNIPFIYMSFDDDDENDSNYSTEDTEDDEAEHDENSEEYVDYDEDNAISM